MKASYGFPGETGSTTGPNDTLHGYIGRISKILRRPTGSPRDQPIRARLISIRFSDWAYPGLSNSILHDYIPWISKIPYLPYSELYFGLQGSTGVG